jgi:diaminohydroxyphosphoribosylaminopyrimidine deaminase/5-amino-6-(5-phosphoribosylamino)uracil reductase
LVDELLLYVAPTLLGPEARPLAQLPAITELTAAQQFEFHEIAVVGGDLRLRLRPRRVRATA